MTLSRRQQWILFTAVLAIVALWPPQEDGEQSLLIKTVRLAADPAGRLPFLPEQLDFGLSDDPQAVELRDELVRRYDDALASGPLMRTRLKLKVLADPFDRSTERQLLLVAGAIVGFVVLRRAAST